MHKIVTASSLAGALAFGIGIAGPAQASSPSNAYSATVTGQYVTVGGSIVGGGYRNTLSAKATIGAIEAKVDSAGISTLNGFSVPAGTKAGARGDLAIVKAGPLNTPVDHVQTTVPKATGPSDKTYVPLRLGALAQANAITGHSEANLGRATLGAGKHGTVASVNGDAASVSLLDLGSSVGILSPLLPQQLRHPVLELDTVRAHTTIGSTLNKDGTHGLEAGGVGGFAALQVLGGAAHGGVTLGIVNADSGAAKDVAGTRVWATGKKGGAGCSYTQPGALHVAIGKTSVLLPLSAGRRITLPGHLGYLDAEVLAPSTCKASADGTHVTATGAGIGISLHLTLPNGTSLADATASLPDLTSASITVPKGGIKAS